MSNYCKLVARDMYHWAAKKMYHAGASHADVGGFLLKHQKDTADIVYIDETVYFVEDEVVQKFGERSDDSAVRKYMLSNGISDFEVNEW